MPFNLLKRWADSAALDRVLELEDALAEEKIKTAKLAARLDVSKLRGDELALLLEEIRQGIRANVAANVQAARANGAPDPLLGDMPPTRGKAWRLKEDAG